MNAGIWIWGFVVVATLVTEFLTDELVCIWFSVGAVVSLICAIFGVPEWAQIVIFVVVSALCLILTRPFVKKVINKPTEKTNVDSLVGKSTKLLTAIKDNENLGTVKFSGVVWSAKSENGKPIKKDTKVIVVDIKGNKLIVREDI